MSTKTTVYNYLFIVTVYCPIKKIKIEWYKNESHICTLDRVIIRANGYHTPMFKIDAYERRSFHWANFCTLAGSFACRFDPIIESTQITYLDCLI